MTDALTITNELKRLTLLILTHDGHRGILAGLVGELVEILENAADFDIDQQSDVIKGEIAASDGLAISPTQAAMCAGEFQRTAVFLRGLHDAIAEAVELKKKGPLHVFYAGCGPYATLAVPLMTIFPPEVVRFTILDIHPVSVASAKSVINRLGLERSVVEYVLGDACEHTIADSAIPDIILSETMSTALEREPQVAIMRHLLGQAPDAVMVPASVKVDAFLVDTSQDVDVIVPETSDSSLDRQVDRISVGSVFELDSESIRSWPSDVTDRLPAAAIQIPAPPESHYRPYLFTSITTYGEHVLRTHDSSLTGIREIPVAEDLSGGVDLQFYYRLGENPCLIGEVTT